jgi:DNA-binding FadR family transcriptional regulator
MQRQSNSHVAREIARLIVTGAWHEGWTLPREIELASQFQVSRTSIRESLSILKAKGLIAARQKAGTHVRERINWNMLDAELLDWTWSERPSEDFAQQLLQVRRIVEPEACAICAERGTDADLARIERAYREMDAAGTDSRAYAEPDLRFHRSILTATGNHFLIAFGATVEAGAADVVRAVDAQHRRAAQEPAVSSRGPRRDMGAQSRWRPRCHAPADGSDRTQHHVGAGPAQERGYDRRSDAGPGLSRADVDFTSAPDRALSRPDRSRPRLPRSHRDPPIPPARGSCRRGTE